MRKKKIAVMGFGHIGEYIYKQLKNDKRFIPTPYDIKFGNNLTSENELEEIIDNSDAVIAATPFFLNKKIALICSQFGKTYFDLTESNEVSDYIKSLENVTAPMVCQCGLAPGMVSIIATELFKTLQEVDSVAIRVGALPKTPNNHMGYTLTWSTEGLINEYIHPCKAVVDSKLTMIQPLEDIEPVNFNGIQLEAANTSGGLGTLADTLNHYAKSVTYKTLRYPNHWNYMKFLRDDLKLKDNFKSFVDIFNNSVPHTSEDRIFILIKVIGKNGEKNIFPKTVTKEMTYSNIIECNKENTAIQISTGSGILAVVDVWANGKINHLKGLVKQEDLPTDLVIKSKYAQCYFPKDKTL